MRACKSGEVRLGEMFVTRSVELQGPRWIINFPTKGHWRQRAKLESVRDGLVALHEVIRTNQIRSIAIPPLGCGNGGLDWRVVRPLIEAAAGGPRRRRRRRLRADGDVSKRCQEEGRREAYAARCPHR